MKPALLLRALIAGIGSSLALSSLATAQTKLDKVSFGTNWVAEAEHGGFFQAVADGTYKSYGLDVTIVPGGPNDNNRMLLIAGKLDFFMAANTLMSFDAVANKVPVVTVAAMSKAASDQASSGRSPSSTKAFGPPAPSLCPEPAAAMTAVARVPLRRGSRRRSDP